MLRLTSLAILVCLLTLSACTATNAPSAGTNCKPDAKLTCGCADGSNGVAVCSKNGASVGVCSCPATCAADVSSDPDNCGACGHSCRGGACANAQCQPVSITSDVVSSLAVDANAVYWTAPGDIAAPTGTVKKMPLADGAIVTLASGEATPRHLIVDATHAYWSLGSSPYGIRSVALTGAGPATIVANVEPDDLTVDGSSIYWAGSGQLGRAPLVGGSTSILATPADCLPLSMAVDSHNAYFTCASNQSPTFDSIHSVPLLGGVDGVIAKETEQFGQSLILQANDVVWTTFSGVHSVPVTGGTAVPLAKGLEFVSKVASDGAFIYLVDGGGWVMKVPVGGGLPIVLLEELDPAPREIAVDASSIYLGGDGGLQRVAK